MNPSEETREEKPYVTAEEERLLPPVTCAKQTNKQTKNTAQQKTNVSVEAL